MKAIRLIQLVWAGTLVLYPWSSACAIYRWWQSMSSPTRRTTRFISLYSVFAAGRTLTMEDVAAEIARTRPLSATMKERIQGLRDWSRGRTVSAH